MRHATQSRGSAAAVTIAELKGVGCAVPSTIPKCDNMSKRHKYPLPSGGGTGHRVGLEGGANPPFTKTCPRADRITYRHIDI